MTFKPVGADENGDFPPRVETALAAKIAEAVASGVGGGFVEDPTGSGIYRWVPGPGSDDGPPDAGPVDWADIIGKPGTYPPSGGPYVLTVNGDGPDGSGDVTVDTSGGGGIAPADEFLVPDQTGSSGKFLKAGADPSQPASWGTPASGGGGGALADTGWRDFLADAYTAGLSNWAGNYLHLRAIGNVVYVQAKLLGTAGTVNVPLPADWSPHQRFAIPMIKAGTGTVVADLTPQENGFLVIHHDGTNDGSCGGSWAVDAAPTTTLGTAV